jgi:hypothetical protein
MLFNDAVSATEFILQRRMFENMIINCESAFQRERRSWCLCIQHHDVRLVSMPTYHV